MYAPFQFHIHHLPSEIPRDFLLPKMSREIFFRKISLAIFLFRFFRLLHWSASGGPVQENAIPSYYQVHKQKSCLRATTTPKNRDFSCEFLFLVHVQNIWHKSKSSGGNWEFASFFYPLKQADGCMFQEACYLCLMF